MTVQEDKVVLVDELHVSKCQKSTSEQTVSMTLPSVSSSNCNSPSKSLDQCSFDEFVVRLEMNDMEQCSNIYHYIQQELRAERKFLPPLLLNLNHFTSIIIRDLRLALLMHSSTCSIMYIIILHSQYHFIVWLLSDTLCLLIRVIHLIPC
jgi:hypothetical protein